MVSVIETLKQIEAICPPGEFLDALTHHRKGIFCEVPEQFGFRIGLASELFEEHFPENELVWEPWQRQAAEIFKQAQFRWLTENNLSNELSG